MVLFKVQIRYENIRIIEKVFCQGNEARLKSGFKVYMEDKCMPILPKSYSFKHLIPLAAFSYLSESYQHRIHITHCIARDKVGMFGYSMLLIDQRKT